MIGVPAAGSERLAAVAGARLAAVSGTRPAAVSSAAPSGYPAGPSTVPLPLVPSPGSSGRPSRRTGRFAAGLRRLLPPGWFTARVDPGRPGAAALALVAAAAALVAAAGVWTQRPRAEPVDVLPTIAVPAEAPPTAAPTGPGADPLVVSVVGKVRVPGLVTLPVGSRVADAVVAAGGALPGVDLTGINLARRVGDGEQIAVGVAQPPGVTDGADDSDATAAGSPGGTPGSGPVDLNRATAAQLDALPGVGPVTAERILEWRAHNGRFNRVEQLREIDGIGEVRFGRLRGLVRVS